MDYKRDQIAGDDKERIDASKAARDPRISEWNHSTGKIARARRPSISGRYVILACILGAMNDGNDADNRGRRGQTGGLHDRKANSNLTQP